MADLEFQFISLTRLTPLSVDRVAISKNELKRGIIVHEKQKQV